MAPSPPPPVALREDNVPDDLICSICMTLPAEPLMTPCDHLFCRTCIHQALSNQNLCPIDRRPCSRAQLKPLDGLLSRIWSAIQVKCGHHENGCAWRGSIADYSSHLENCSVGRIPTIRNSNSDVIEELERLRRENEDLREKKTSLERELDQAENLANDWYNKLWDAERLVETLQEDKKSLKRKLRDADDDIDDLKADKKSLKRSLKDRPNLPTLFHGNYDFRRENVVELSQLISRYLEDKPNDINSNRIFNCVSSCFTDLKRGYGDNPEHYYTDMRMLLATCLASTWFSDNQRSSIEKWYKERFR